MFNGGGYGYYSFMKLSLRTLLKCNQVNMYVHWTPHVCTATWKIFPTQHFLPHFDMCIFPKCLEFTFLPSTFCIFFSFFKFIELSWLTPTHCVILCTCSLIYIWNSVSLSCVSPPRSQRWNDQAHLRMPGDHPVGAGEANDENVPQGGEEGEEARQRSRWRRLLRRWTALWPPRDETPEVCYSFHRLWKLFLCPFFPSFSNFLLPLFWTLATATTTKWKCSGFLKQIGLAKNQKQRGKHRDDTTTHTLFFVKNTFWMTNRS